MPLNLVGFEPQAVCARSAKAQRARLGMFLFLPSQIRMKSAPRMAIVQGKTFAAERIYFDPFGKILSIFW